MKKLTSKISGFNLRVFLAVAVCSVSAGLIVLSLAALERTPRRGLTLALERLQFAPKSELATQRDATSTPYQFNPAAPLAPNAPTFGHPIISGIGGLGFEESIRIDPT